MKYKYYIVSLIITKNIFGYNYLPDDMPINKILILSAHNSPQSKAYGWRYYQHLDTLENQWYNGVRGAKVNLHWRYPISLPKQLIEAFGSKVETLGTELEITATESNSSFVEKLATTGAKIADKIGSFFQGKDKEQTKEPFIALAHEGDGNSNCLVSIFEKEGELDPAIGYFQALSRLLEKNPNDIFFLLLEDYTQKRSTKNRADRYTSEQAREKLLNVLIDSGLAKYAYKSNDNFRTIPTVGELRQLNKRIIIFTDENFNAQNDILNYYSPEAFSATYWEFDWEKDLNNGICTLWEHRANPDSAFFIINAGPEMSINDDSKKASALKILQKLGFPKTIGGHIIKPTDYKIIHSKQNILKRILNCENSNDSHPVNLLGLDFISITPKGEKLYDTVKEINKNRAEALSLILNPEPPKPEPIQIFPKPPFFIGIQPFKDSKNS